MPAGFVDEVMCNQVERLSQLYASQLLDEPVIFQSVLKGFEARISGEEVFLECFVEVELLEGAELISKAVWKYDLITVNERTWKAKCS